MNEIIQSLEANATNGEEVFCYISAKKLKAIKHLSAKELQEKNDLQSQLSIANKKLDKIEKYCKENDLVGIKGRLRKNKNDFRMVVEAEKITFLSGTGTSKGGD